MYLFRRVSDLQAFLYSERVNNRTVGFIPTMGALHDGHLSLISRSLAENQITVASIFVNPTQFNEATDLKKYPRTPGKDLEKLNTVGCDVVFLPDVDDVYPPDVNTTLSLDLAGLDEMMEGAKRPGHFDGVAQVVKRLIDIVQPDFLYMGQKDYQQQLIIRKMIDLLDLPLKLVMVPTERELDGLAMSSRNALLLPEHRTRAVLVQQNLQIAKERLGNGDNPRVIEAEAMEAMTQPGFRPEYFSIVNGQTLQPFNGEESAKSVVACAAVWAGEVRLIDNIILMTTK